MISRRAFIIFWRWSAYCITGVQSEQLSHPPGQFTNHAVEFPAKRYYDLQNLVSHTERRVCIMPSSKQVIRDMHTYWKTHVRPHLHCRYGRA
jgi:hypothetical protein